MALPAYLMLGIQIAVKAIGVALFVVAIVLPVYLHRSRYRHAAGVEARFNPSPAKRLSMLRDFLIVLGIYTPLSLVGLTVVLSSQPVSKVPIFTIVYSLVAFLMLLFDVVIIFVFALLDNFGGRSVPLKVFPLSLGILISASGFLVMSLAEILV